MTDPVRTWCWPNGIDKPIEEVEEEVQARTRAMEHLKEKNKKNIAIERVDIIQPRKFINDCGELLLV
ncbi:hypothetical protein Pyn_36549 [Prunus yedoensis var. nudiflora]|uniref:Uncharacterized protein n=1 Tax=Prunus yedoensis var. nudiflora TaxID=2094558 RepID=A0A314YAD5_PRUYE|nr:hypothetical protein Pyn_36549 [Prunus yedoensis var. nudiflora]